MSAYYSTQASIEARITALRLNGYIDIDGDGYPDEDALTSGFKFARGLIRGKLYARYGSTVIDAWDSTTAPELIQAISDDLCIYQYFTMSPAFRETGEIIRANALALLDQIAGGVVELYEVDAPTFETAIVTGRIPSDFDPERELNDMTVRTTWTLPDAREIDGY